MGLFDRLFGTNKENEEIVVENTEIEVKEQEKNEQGESLLSLPEEIKAQEIETLSRTIYDIADQYIPAEGYYAEGCIEDAEKLILSGITLGNMAGCFREGNNILKDGKTKDVVPFILNGACASDDTIMSIATMTACHAIKRGACGRTNYDAGKQAMLFASTYRLYAKLFPDAEYGPHFYKWAILDINDKSYKSYGDGAAMRAGIIGACFPTIRNTAVAAVASAMPTHSHPEGIKGAAVTAVSVWLALHGASMDDIFKYVMAHYPDGFRTEAEIRLKDYMSPDLTLNDLKDLDPKTMSAASQWVVPEAFINFFYSSSYESCIRNAFEYIGDTDTIGAISGAIAAAYYKNTDVKNLNTKKIVYDGTKDAFTTFFMEK